MPDRVFLTGISGFIGGHVALALLRAGYAVRGCRYLQHVASPLAARMPRNREELIRPAVEGTRRALAAALDAGIERVVLTSSAAAIAYGHPAGRTAPFTSADWSRTEGDGVSA